MKRRNLWKMAAIVFAINVAVALIGGGFVANAKDPGPKDNNLFVYANTVLGSGGLPFPSGPVCALTNRFPQGQQVVWRIRVLNKALNPMDDAQLESVYVRLPDGQRFYARYGGHGRPEPTDYFWAVSWLIPDDYPTGSLGYEVVATAHGHHVGTFEDFNVGPSQLTIIEGIEEYTGP